MIVVTEIVVKDVTDRLILSENYATITGPNGEIDVTRSPSGIVFYLGYSSGKRLMVNFHEALVKIAGEME